MFQKSPRPSGKVVSKLNSELRFRTLIENSFEAIILVNRKGELIYLSPTAERMTGFSLQQENNIQGLTFIHPDDREKGSAIFKKSIEKPGTPVPFQIRMLHIDGHSIWVEGIINNLLHDRNVQGIVTNYRDITERKHYEEELTEYNQRIYDILESVNDCFYACDRNWIIRYWNKAAEELFNTPREQAVGKYLWDFFPGSTELRSYTELHRTMNEGIKTAFEDFYNNTWFSINTYPSKEGISVFFRDITENKRVEKLTILEKEVLKFFNAKKNSIEETITLLLNGVQQIHPDMLCSVLKYKDGRLYNWSSPHLPKEFNEAVEGIKAGIGVGSCGTAAFIKENVIVTDISTDPLWKDYTALAARCELKACWSHLILDENDNVLGTFATYYRTIRHPKRAEQDTIERARIILKNIIENKRAEEKILELNAELEERVALRTEQLQTAIKELEAFSYSISHDLRAPLRSVHGYSKILLEDYYNKLDKEGQHTLNVIMANAQRMGQLIDDLLNFSKLGKAAITRTTVDMSRMVNEVLQELQLGGIKIPAQLSINDLKPAYCDSTLIKQVWNNLVSNAIKYSSMKTDPAIEIGMQESGNSITYYVKDNGAGFDMQYYHKLFGVFQRLHKMEDFPGTGVGLAIVQRIITRHEGMVWAEAKVNEGATFYFSLGNKNE